MKKFGLILLPLVGFALAFRAPISFANDPAHFGYGTKTVKTVNNKKITSKKNTPLVGQAAYDSNRASNKDPVQYAANDDNFGYGSKIPSDDTTVTVASKKNDQTNYFIDSTNRQYAESAETYGYGSMVPEDQRGGGSKKKYLHIRVDGGLLLPTDARIIRGNLADTLSVDKIGYQVGVAFGGSFNPNTISQIDLEGLFNYSGWGATVLGTGVFASNKQRLEAYQGLVEASWRPLVTDKGLISPFFSVGLGFNVTSLTNQNDILVPLKYDHKTTALLGVFQFGAGFDYFFTPNWGIGAKYNYSIPFGKEIEIGNGVTYTPSNAQVISVTGTARF
ncbi:MAG: outer membrane beta-barrel protein [Alphaproteobacteria bacterium]|nr:outer membrane beta-barrel protein [Alphaproteobacteria bacterium]